MREIAIFIIKTLMTLCLLIWMSGANPAVSEEMLDISVHESASVANKNVLLKDIASIQAEQGFADRIENIVIGAAPLPGKERIFKRAQIITRLKQHKVELKRTSFNCPEEIRVTTLHKEFGQQEIEEIITQYIHKHMPWNPDEVTILDIIYKPFQIQEGNITYRIAVPKNENYLGRFSAQISFSVNGQFIKNVDVSAVIKVITPIVVSVQQIERHQVIAEEDVTVEERDITHIAKDYVASTHEVIGKRATCKIGADKIIKQAMIEEAPLIHKGDLITIFVETNTFKISTSGEALQDGRAGDKIEVYNTHSSQKLYGYVRSGKEVEVRF
jgi:flagella basal body P-ring formation protein FlgA